MPTPSHFGVVFQFSPEVLSFPAKRRNPHLIGSRAVLFFFQSIFYFALFLAYDIEKNLSKHRILPPVFYKNVA